MDFSYLIYIGIFVLAFVLYLLFCDADITLLLAEKFGKPLSSVKGKVFWIIGASSGIGEYIAYELVSNGAKVVISGRREDQLAKVKAQCLVIGKKSGVTESDILSLPLDVSKLESHQQYFDTVLQHFGQLDVLINNAGRSQRAQWQNIDIKLDREMFDCNVFGLLNLTRVVLPHFLSRKQGHVAVMSSVCGKVGAPCSATYNATKHALHGYFETLRTELSSEGIAVSMICPGPVFSDLLSACALEKSGQKLGGAMSPKDRRMQTDRCARLSVVAIVNKIDEAWVIINPVLIAMYFAQYAPTLYRKFTAHFGARLGMKLRDSRTDLVNSAPSMKKSD